MSNRDEKSTKTRKPYPTVLATGLKRTSSTSTPAKRAAAKGAMALVAVGAVPSKLTGKKRAAPIAANVNQPERMQIERSERGYEVSFVTKSAKRLHIGLPQSDPAEALDILIAAYDGQFRTVITRTAPPPPLDEKFAITKTSHGYVISFTDGAGKVFVVASKADLSDATEALVDALGRKWDDARPTQQVRRLPQAVLPVTWKGVKL